MSKCERETSFLLPPISYTLLSQLPNEPGRNDEGCILFHAYILTHEGRRDLALAGQTAHMLRGDQTTITVAFPTTRAALRFSRSHGLMMSYLKASRQPGSGTNNNSYFASGKPIWPRRKSPRAVSDKQQHQIEGLIVQYPRQTLTR